MDMIRQPIVCMLGHVDHGKTALLDKIRGTAIQKKEVAGITQHIGATEIPIEIIKEIGKDLMDLFKVEFKIPGLLFIDTPGHEAFSSLRQRGSSIADLAVLVVDVTSGFQPQTYESIDFLRKFKTPFVVAANKIDLIPGWKDSGTTSFLKSWNLQREDTKQRLEEVVYKIVEKLGELGFNSERFDRVRDFTKEIAIVPTSAVTGEGIAELLLLLVGLSQRYLEESLKVDVSGPARGTVLEKKEMRGVGTVIDVIVYDGILTSRDYLVIGGIEGPIVTKVRAILKPKELKEIRMARSKDFVKVDEVRAACGVRIIAPNLEEVIPGMPFRSVRSEKEIEEAKREIERSISEIRFERDVEGIVVRVDSLGSLEALIKVFGDLGVQVKKADIGPPTKKDVLLLESFVEKKPELSCIVCFNVDVPEDVRKLAEEKGVKIINEKVIYWIKEKYLEYKEETIRMRILRELEKISFPAKIKILPGYVFRISKPAIVGVEVLGGELRPSTYLMREDGKEVGLLKSIQYEGKSLRSAKKGERVAISIDGPTVGRQIKEGDILYTSISERDFYVLKKYKSYLTEDTIEVLREIVRIKRSKNPIWGMREFD